MKRRIIIRKSALNSKRRCKHTNTGSQFTGKKITITIKEEKIYSLDSSPRKLSSNPTKLLPITKFNTQKQNRKLQKKNGIGIGIGTGIWTVNSAMKKPNVRKMQWANESYSHNDLKARSNGWVLELRPVPFQDPNHEKWKKK